MAKSSVFRTCRPEELETLTRSGWSLKSVLSQEAVIEVLDTVAAWDKGNENSNDHGYYRGAGWQHTQVPRKVASAEVLFLLELNESSAVAELEEKLKKAQHDVTAIAAKVKEHEKKAEGHNTTVSIKDEEIRRLNGYLDSAQKDRTALREAKDKLERDLAKIQRAVGDLRYQEIVGGSVTKA